MTATRSARSASAVAALAVAAALTIAAATAGQAATDVPSGGMTARVVVPPGTGPVDATMSEFRLLSDDSIVTGTPTLLRGQRVELLWRGLPDGTWQGVIAGNGVDGLSAGSATAADRQLRSVFTVPDALADGTYALTFWLGPRELRPSFRFTVTGGPAPTPTSPPGGSASPRPSAPAGGGQVPPSVLPGTGGQEGSSPVDGAERLELLTVSGVKVRYDYRLDPLNGTLDVSFTVTNQGNQPLAGDAVATVRGPFGRVAAGDPTTLAVLAPGKSRAASVRVTGVPQAGLLRVDLDLTPRRVADVEDAVQDAVEAAAGEAGEGTVETVSHRLAGPAEPADELGEPSGDDALAAVHREASTWAVPWIVVGPLLTAALGVATWLTRGRWLPRLVTAFRGGAR